MIFNLIYLMILLVLITCIVTSNETTYLYLRSLLLKIQNTIQKYVYIHDIHGIDASASAAPPAAAGGKKKRHQGCGNLQLAHGRAYHKVENTLM